MIVFDDILKLLKDNGWSAYRLSKERIISNGTISRLRNRQSVSTDTIDTVCRLCDCQPGDIMRYEKDEKDGD